MVKFHVSSLTSRYSEPPTICLEGLTAGDRVIIELSITDDETQTWKSSGQFIADHKGRVCLDTAPSSAGSYKGVDEDGLWWSLFPEGYSDYRDFQRQAKIGVHKMGGLAINPIETHKYRLNAFIENQLVAHVDLKRSWLQDESVEEIDHAFLRGKIISQPVGKQKNGCIIVITGSDGGTDTGAACALAAMGYNVMALAHFAYDDRPPTLARIDLEYFEAAIDWMTDRFDSEPVAIQGRSRGGDLVLLLGAMFPSKVAGVASLVGYSHTISGWEEGDQGWTIPPFLYQGEPVPFLSLAPPEIEDQVIISTEGGMVWSGMPEYGRSQDNAEAAEIKVENTKCPILLISGGVDALWHCSDASDRVVDRLRRYGYQHSYTHLRIDDMGHRIPWPHTVTSLSRGAQHPLVDIFLKSGGEPLATARATWPVWNALRDHYQECLS